MQFADKTDHFICPPRSDKGGVHPFFLKPLFILNHTAFFVVTFLLMDARVKILRDIRSLAQGVAGYYD